MTIERVGLAEADQFQAAMSQALVICGTSTSTLTDINQKPIPEEGGQPAGLRAVDTALESWNRSTVNEITVPWMPNQGATPRDDEVADEFWADGDLDWFLVEAGDSVRDAKPGEVAAAQ